MTSTTATIRNGSVPLPKEIEGKWRNREVRITCTPNSLLIEPLALGGRSPLTLTEMAMEFRKAARKSGLTTKVISAEIKQVRKKLYR